MAHADLTPAAGRSLVLVSADAGSTIRREVQAGRRPCPEYLRLESRHQAQLLDWRMAGPVRRRSLRAVVHAVRALPPARTAGAVLSDGEHVGLPLAVAMSCLHVATPHVMLGHHLTTPAKLAILRRSPALRRIDRVLVHSRSQADALIAELALPPRVVQTINYGVDTDFWAPWTTRAEQRLVVSAGREHRDYATLATALAGEDLRGFVTDSSGHSPRARRQEPFVWPANVERGPVSFLELRELYRSAGVVVVPLLPSSFPAGITAVLEAMAMGKAVVVTETAGLRGVVANGETGVVVPAGDTVALRDAVRRLLASPFERARLGDQARQVVLGQWSLDRFVDGLAGHLAQVAAFRAGSLS